MSKRLSEEKLGPKNLIEISALLKKAAMELHETALQFQEQVKFEASAIKYERSCAYKTAKALGEALAMFTNANCPFCEPQKGGSA